MNVAVSNLSPSGLAKAKWKLDPFAFLPKHASAIKGLGGAELGPDPKYGFHTAYRVFKPGLLTFIVQFDDLVATFGELTVHVNGFVPESGQNARLANAVVIDLAKIAGKTARFDISVNSVPGVSYAIVGLVFDGTDASAKGLQIIARQSVKRNEERIWESSPSPYASETIEVVNRLISEELPRFGDPVSQPCTPAQFDEQAFRVACRAVGKDDHDRLQLWRTCYIYQSIRRYGFLAVGARGLSIGPAPDGLLRTLQAQHCSVETLQMDRPDGNQQDLSILHGYDFLFSFDLIRSDRPKRQGMQSIEDLMCRLRPGGIAIHVFDIIDLGSEFPEASSPDAPLTRRNIEQLSLNLLSSQNNVAQLCFGGREPRHQPIKSRFRFAVDEAYRRFSISPFGFIAWKA